MINATMKINEITIRNANLLSNVKKFVEKFANMTIVSLIDFFFNYDQLDLALRSRDIIAFQTSLDLLRFTRLPQETINSMTQFVKVVTKILKDHLRTRCRSFLDDIEMKESRSRYDDREVASNIRLFVLEHIQWLDVVLVDLELANVTISKEKSQWCMNDLKIVEFVCDSNDRSSNSVKIIKIVKWSFCVDVLETRTFIDVCVYYRIWVKNFVLMIESIYRLFKFEVSFVWDQKQQDSMNYLKLALIFALALRSIDYSSLVENIVLTMNFNLREWDAILMQIDFFTKKRHSSRYESDMWSKQKFKYDASKRECKDLMKVLKKIRFWLYDVTFVIEIDANTLIAQLNKSIIDLLETLMTKWLTWIRFFDFDVKHISKKKHIATNELSRRSRCFSNDANETQKKNINDFIDDQLNCVRVFSIRVVEMSKSMLNDNYFENSMQITIYLTSLRKFDDMTQKQFRKFKTHALKFMIRDQHLFRKVNKNMFLRRVIDKNENKDHIIKKLHDEEDHRDKKKIYRKVANRYW